MHPTVRADNLAKLSRFQCKCSVLKWLLHLPRSKAAQIPTFLGGRAIRVNSSKFRKFGRVATDLCLISLQDLDSFFFGTSDVCLERI